MKFMLLINHGTTPTPNDPEAWARLSQEEQQAIHADDRLPADQKHFAEINADFFGPDVTGWGSPGGADDAHVTTQDHRLVTAWPRGAGGCE